MDLIDMKQSPSEKKAEEVGMDERPDYPYGLSLHLGKEQLEKLGIEGLPETGTPMLVMARVFVEQAGEHTTNGEQTERHITLQITEMSLSPEATKVSAAEKMFGESS